MDADLVARAVAAAGSLGRRLGLAVDDAVVVQNSNALTLRLLPCDVLARTAVAGQEVAAFEVDLALRLAAAGAPIASLDPRVEPRVYERDGFAVTFWSYYDSAGGAVPPAAYADALRRLHAAMRSVDAPAPHFVDRVAEAEALLTDRHRTPALGNADRALLLDALREGRAAVEASSNPDQLLHGEPHPGNLLDTRDGPLFIDFETGCRGPVEFDVAHVPGAVSAGYPELDPELLEESRRLVLAMVAAWRWDVRDGFPNGRKHAVTIVDVLRTGPPWPTLDALPAGELP